MSPKVREPLLGYVNFITKVALKYLPNTIQLIEWFAWAGPSIKLCGYICQTRANLSFLNDQSVINSTCAKEKGE